MIGPLLFGAAGATALIIRQDPLQPVLITSQAPQVGLDLCLQTSYYGAYGGSTAQRDYIYLPSADCLSGPHAFDALEAGSLTYLDKADLGDGRIVWVGQAGVKPDLLEDDTNMLTAWSIIESRAGSPMTAVLKRQTKPQSHFTASTPKTLRMLHASAHSLLLSVPEEYVPILDTLLPRQLVPVALPVQPYAATTGENAWEPVPKRLAKNLANITESLKFDSKLDKVLNEGLEVDQLRRDIRWLTGEGPSGIESRHSFTEGAIKAAHYIKGQLPHVLEIVG
jgi:hypothetical protein